MKRILTLFLGIWLLSLSLCACGNEIIADSGSSPDPSAPETVKESAADTFDYPAVADPITRAKLDAIPLADNSMTSEQLRKICTDYFELAQTFAWTPKDSYEYVQGKNEKVIKIKKGTVYGGFPYVGVGTGNLYRWLEYFDEETGVFDIKNAGKDPVLFGNQCSQGAFGGWGRVVNSANYTWTQLMTQKNGFINVGPYTYDKELRLFGDTKNSTNSICEQNGEQVMYESYAKLLPADGLVNFSISAGHVRMVSDAPIVVRKADGTIDPEQSFVFYHDQGKAWKEKTQSDGTPYTVQANAHHKASFAGIYKSGCLPFTFAEFLGTDPVEDAVATIAYSGETATAEQLGKETLKTNYSISDVFVVVKDPDGKQVYSSVRRTTVSSTTSFALSEIINALSLKKYAKEGTHTVEIQCQVMHGERLVAYSGTLVLP